jgi:DmsE family decaheme c-type cytochrome
MVRLKNLTAASALCVFVGAVLLAAPQQPAPPPAPPAEAAAPVPASTPAASPPATYVGSEACQACHDDIYKALLKSPHSAVESSKHTKWAGKACESCHGPGSKHADSLNPADIINPLKLDAAAADKDCLQCHLNRPTQIGRIESSHAKDQIPCTSCHSVHAHGPDGLVVRKPAAINEQCGACHTEVVAQFQRPYRHRLPEGAMSCVDCHNPHGSFRPGMMSLVSANEQPCLKCHSDLRGPFTFEHAPVRFEGCGECHEPHGSANPRMLIRQEVRLVCLECHANLPSAPAAKAALGVVPPSFHDLRSPQFQNCTICHQKIHGSYIDRNLER